MARAGRWLPSRARGLRHPAVAWTYTLPVWILLCAGDDLVRAGGRVSVDAPAAGRRHRLLLAPTRSEAAVRAASVIVLAAAGTLWMRDTIDLLRFMVALLGRLPFVTPVYAYPALIAAAGLMIVPPFFAAAASPTPLLRPSLATGLALAAVAVTSIAAWLAPAYTYEQPLRRYARVIQEPGAAHRGVAGRLARTGARPWRRRARRLDHVGSGSHEHSVGPPRRSRSSSAPRPRLSVPHRRLDRRLLRRADRGCHRHQPSRHGAPQGTVHVRLLRPPRRHRPGPQQPARRRCAPAAGRPPSSRPPPEGIAWEATFAAPPRSSSPPCGSPSRPAASPAAPAGSGCPRGCPRTAWSGPPGPPGSRPVRSAAA